MSMNPFESTSLSPLARPPLACALPYNLTWSDLRPILSDLDEGRSPGPQAFLSHEKQGLHGGPNSCILTIRYPATENQFRSETVFVKHIEDPREAEAHKYQYIASRGVPTPRLLATVHRGGAEVILLEFLSTIGIDFRAASEADSMLQLLAQLNAIENPLDFFNPPARDPSPESRTVFDERVRITLTELGRDRALPVTLDTRRAFEAYQIAQNASESMPLAINHGEFYFQQVGWVQRGLARQLVIFDLATMSLCPRFTDLASVLYPLAAYTGRDQVQLFEVYLDRLRQLKQLEAGIEEALRELRLLRVTTSCWSLPWLVEAARSPGVMALAEALSMTANCIYEDLIDLELV